MDKVSWAYMKQTFKAFLQILTEGGNVRVTNDGKEFQADRVDLSVIQRKELVSIMGRLFHALNKKYRAKYKEDLWKPETIDSGLVFNGSSELLFRDSIKDEDFMKKKPTIGDIDITVDQNKFENVKAFLEKIKGSSVLNDTDLKIKFLGHNKEEQISRQSEGKQFNSIFSVTYGKIHRNIQVDFEFSEYDDGKPTRWTKFSHSSEWEDLKQGIKGVHHKYLVRALVGMGVSRNDIVVVTPSSTPDKVKLSSAYKDKVYIGIHKFSVGRGARKALEQQFLPDGKPWKYQGHLVYKELPSETADYIKDPNEILKFAFGEKVNPKKIESFTGLIDLMKDLDQDVLRRVLDRMVSLYWGEDAQELERNNPSLDREVKEAGFKKLTDAFPWYKNKRLEETKTTFYHNYRMT